jgi:hypothetical protein
VSFVPQSLMTTIIQDKAATQSAHFEFLLEMARNAMEQGDLRSAAAYSQMAADQASWNHFGQWASPALEQILACIGECLEAGSPLLWKPRKSKAHERILHVLSEALGIGGHTRLVWRWIQNDSQRFHAIALTRQGARSIPPELGYCLKQGDGSVFRLDRSRGDLIVRARALRAMASEFDRIVLHVHPFDVVPGIAFTSAPNRPPVIYVNHADHVFWPGSRSSDVIAHLRESGAEVSRLRRGVQSDRCLILPTPLTIPKRTMSREEARKQLGVPEDAVVLLSIATPYKYQSKPGELNFVSAVLPVLKKHPRAILLAVGPAAEGQWRSDGDQAYARIKAHGRRSETAVFYQAADIYLDSFPFASTTSTLEAGLYGVPLVAFCPELNGAPLMYSDCPGTMSTMTRTADVECYRSAIATLIENPASRELLGDATRRGIIECHAERGWLNSLENLYTRAAAVRNVSAGCFRKEIANTEDILDKHLASLHDHAWMVRGLDDIVRTHAGLLPMDQRLHVWRVVFGGKFSELPRLMCSDWIRIAIRNGRSRLCGRPVSKALSPRAEQLVRTFASRVNDASGSLAAD